MGFDKASAIDNEVNLFDTASAYGFSPSYELVPPYGFRNSEPSFRSRSSVFSEGGGVLRKTLPSLDSQLFRLKAQFSEISLKALPAAFFLPLLSKSSQIVLSSAKNTVIPALREECICLIPRNFQQNGVRDLMHRAEIKRKTDVQNMLMVLFLRQQGFLVAEDINLAVANSNNALLSGVLGDHPDIPFPAAVSRIATIAIGVAHQRTHAQGQIRIVAEDISKAHAIFTENSLIFSNWVNEVESCGKAESSAAGPTSNASEKNPAGEKEKKDPIVECVKNSKDLNEHEEKLLQCIVDCGE
jgi:hypothetical protein